MAEDDAETQTETGEDIGDGRSTAPQSDYGRREVGIGIAVLLVGAVVAFGVPLAMTL